MVDVDNFKTINETHGYATETTPSDTAASGRLVATWMSSRCSVARSSQSCSRERKKLAPRATELHQGFFGD
jgi:hypothetical protein